MNSDDLYVGVRAWLIGSGTVLVLALALVESVVRAGRHLLDRLRLRPWLAVLWVTVLGAAWAAAVLVQPSQISFGLLLAGLTVYGAGMANRLWITLVSRLHPSWFVRALRVRPYLPGGVAESRHISEVGLVLVGFGCVLWSGNWSLAAFSGCHSPASLSRAWSRSLSHPCSIGAALSCVSRRSPP
jgi:hypothetical protein